MEKDPLLAATHNETKTVQIKPIFAAAGITVISFSEAGVKGKPVEGEVSLTDNALIKARFGHKAMPHMRVIADDTGIFINALRGEPGVRSARWLSEKATTEETTNYCLNRMRGITDRSATFRTVVALIMSDGAERTFMGEISGSILEAVRVPAQPSMPYSPLFVPDGYYKSWAEMTTEEENKISHRGQAFRKALEFLQSLESTN